MDEILALKLKVNLEIRRLISETFVNKTAKLFYDPSIIIIDAAQLLSPTNARAQYKATQFNCDLIKNCNLQEYQMLWLSKKDIENNALASEFKNVDVIVVGECLDPGRPFTYVSTVSSLIEKINELVAVKLQQPCV